MESFISEYDEHLFHEGKHYECYKFMGAHFTKEGNRRGVRFTTWAPNAESITLVGSFSNWELREEYEMTKINEMGLWSIFIQSIKKPGDIYKYALKNKKTGEILLKSDPYGFQNELRPNNASVIIEEKKYNWKDDRYLQNRSGKNLFESPMNVYELHIGSWRKKEDGEFYTYKELAKILPKYIKEMGYTHVELLPVMEHPLDDSWGYQITGYYAPTSRYGSYNDLKILINALHRDNIGVIFDWVPGHFCKDDFGLYKFDGGTVYEYSVESKAENKGWGTANFDLGRPEVKSFLISNAFYWFREFHIDGLRVDAVTNILYLSYGRNHGEWETNKYGGSENIEGIEFLRELNKAVLSKFPNVLMIAEESTAWPLVTKPVDVGGLGFNFKWNMGWMNDVLNYVKIDPFYRKDNHNLITFAMMYNHAENYVLAISHDEVVHGKKSLLDKMWGDYWNKFAGLRAFAAFMMGHPGKKTLFMGAEFGQFIEWRHSEQLDWLLIEEYDMHKNTFAYFKELNNFYINNEALWRYDYDPQGFQWIDADNRGQSIAIFMRKGKKKEDTLIFVCNFTPVVYYDFMVGVPFLAEYKEVFNSDDEKYGGSGQVVEEIVTSEEEPWHNQLHSIKIKVPPMAVIVFKATKFFSNTKKEGIKK